MSFETLVKRATSDSQTVDIQINHQEKAGWRISFVIVFHRNGAAKENERFPVSSLTDGLKRVTIDVERVDLWLVGMVNRRGRQRGLLCCKEEYVREMNLYWMRCSTFKPVKRFQSRCYVLKTRAGSDATSQGVWIDWSRLSFDCGRLQQRELQQSSLE